MLFYSCSNDYNEVIKDVSFETLPEQRAENIEIVRTDSGKVIGKIFAPVLERYSQEENPYELFPEGMKVVTYQKYPKINSSIVCKYAYHDVKTQKWEARDNVVAVNIDGDTLKTEQMFWDLKIEKIYSDKYVNITTKDEIIYGNGFIANQDFTNWKITNVKGTIYLDE